MQLSGANEVPPVTSPGSAFARFTFDDDTNVLTFALTVSGLSPNLVTAAHIHRGEAGVNGPIVHTLSATGFTQVAGSITLSAEDEADLKAGRFYANVHSTDNPGGFARGQLILPSAAAGSPTPTRTAGAVSPPSTGDGGLAGDRDAGVWAGLVAVAGAFFGSGVLLLARRRA